MIPQRQLFPLLLALFALPALAKEPESVLRVCADPDNMPLSNRSGAGFENRIASQLAHDLGRTLEYTWFPQRMGFVRNTLKKKNETTGKFECDVIMGVPAGYELTATTQPYMHSTYALVFAARSEFAGLSTAEDLLKLPAERLKALRIGVFAQSPGVDWLLRNGLLDRAVNYAQQSGDPAENPALIIGRELTAGKIDLAILWGPIAGHLIREHPAPSAWRAVTFQPDSQIRFDYKMAMGTRFGEKEWLDTLNKWIAEHRQDIERILREYQVPLIDSP